MRRDRVQERERGVAVAIVVAGLHGRGEFQNATPWGISSAPLACHITAIPVKTAAPWEDDNYALAIQCSKKPIRVRVIWSLLFPAVILRDSRITHAAPVAKFGTAEITRPYLADS
jgi:hypothetical protein